MNEGAGEFVLSVDDVLVGHGVEAPLDPEVEVEVVDLVVVLDQTGEEEGDGGGDGEARADENKFALLYGAGRETLL